jgi:hypothetical protein
MTAAVLAQVAPSGSLRLLADVKAIGGEGDERAPALLRLEQALGRDFADRLVEALSESAEPQVPRS